jgi:lipopolysaccharide/colanic/teichoic acid biosynthesis glycosyltransferase
MKVLDFSKDSKLKLLDKYGITLKGDSRVTIFGNFLRRFKLDELPQLYNVFIGDMSLVGPRPDIIGYADKLEGKDRIILTVKPGITGPATLAFRHEESILSNQDDPFTYNNEVIWLKKIELNRQYVENWSFKKDINYILQTIFN